MQFRVSSFLTIPSFLVATFLGVYGVGAAAQQKASLVSCRPASERTGPAGCWIVASKELGKLAGTAVYWTLDAYPTVEAAQSAKTENGEVVQALGKIWLFTVGEKLKAPVQGSRMSEIGPLPVKAGEEYTAQYMEAILAPGSVSRTHVHSGPEAFYTESGQSCLETPARKQVGEKGKDIVIAEGEPMELVATGNAMRRGIALVLHSSGKPATTVVESWKSKGLCLADAGK